MSGLSLVELMIALTIGLIVLAAVSTVFVNSRANYVTQESAARLQENARFAIHFLARDLRMAGYYGCAGDADSITNNLNPGSTAQAFDFSKPIEAIVNDQLYPSGITLSFPTDGAAVDSRDADCPDKVGAQCAGTSGFAVRMVDASNPIDLQKTMPNTAAAAFVNENSGLAIGDIVMLSDCAGADIFQSTNKSTSSGKDTLVHNSGAGTPGNSTQRLSRIYEAGEAQILKFDHRVYYIGTGQSGHPALWRMGIDGDDEEELVEGIENVQIDFGVDTAGDRTPRVYLPATDANLGTTEANWANVISARVTVTARPTLDPVEPDDNPQAVKAKNFVATVLLRNLQ